MKMKRIAIVSCVVFCLFLGSGAKSQNTVDLCSEEVAADLRAKCEWLAGKMEKGEDFEWGCIGGVLLTLKKAGCSL
jgi:hypothetical protein